MIIYGFNAVRECCLSEKIQVKQVFFSTKKLGFEYRGAPVYRKDKVFISKLAETSQHQGIICEIEKFPYTFYKKFMYNEIKHCNLVILDRVNDPHNLGAVIRVCECAGVDGVIISSKFGAKVTSTVFKVSAGAAAYQNVSLTDDLDKAVCDLKSAGFSVYSIENTEKSLNYSKAPDILTNKNVFIFGSEGEGISGSLIEFSDSVFNIPMKGQVNSLNLSTSVSAFLFSVLK